MKEDYIRWYTPHLNREFEMLTLGHGGYPVILFPVSPGRYPQNTDFHFTDSVAAFVDAGRFKLYCPDGIDDESWHNRAIHPADRVRTHIAYENVVHDIVTHACRETGRARVCVAGAGQGGYHAVNYALRHPARVGCLISLGGTLDIKPFLDGYYDENCYFHNPVDYLPGLADPAQLAGLRRLAIVLGTGDRDPGHDRCLALSALLHTKGIAHLLDDRAGCGQDWHDWRDLLPHYLDRIHE